MSSSTWQDHFQENLVGLEPPRVGSFLAFAIAEGRLPEEEYLSWASQELHLPVLESRFFTEQAPEASLLHSHPNPGWNSLCFPVREWDGVLMVACLEKPETPIEGNVVYLLAAPSAMNTWWEKISTAQPAARIDMPDGLATPIPNAANGTPTSPLDFSGILVPPPSSPSGPKPSMPPPFRAKTKEDATAPTDASNTPAAETVNEDTTRTNLTLQTHQLPEAPASLNTVSAGPGQSHLLSAVATGIPDFSTHVREALRKISGSYAKAMFLAGSVDGGSLLPIQWSEGFKPAPGAGGIPLESPSLFRIVTTTEKSYHGHVVVNDVNNRFFAEWNENVTPAHVTLVPVFYRQRLVGGLLGLGDSSAANMTTLRMVEKVAAEFARHIGGAEDPAAA